MLAWRSLPVPRGEGAGSGPPPGGYLTVPSLERDGIRAAFTSRLGGVSARAHAGLNLSYVSGDDPAAVRSNRGRALASIGARLDGWTSGKQVHGAGVRRVGEAERGAGASDPDSTLPETDAMWTDRPGVALAVLCADCVPVLLADPAAGRVGVIHAGWRGLVGGVIGAAIDAMQPGPGSVATIGPSIGPCCYQVGPEVADAARDALGDEVARDGTLDLWLGARVALRRQGIEDVATAGLCTKCEPHRFFSHRAGDSARQGLIAALTDG